MELFVIRHGQSLGDIEHRAEGNWDAPLTELGIEQATRLADFFTKREIRFDRIISSPLQRANKTATIVAESQQIELAVDERIAERNIGVWAGMPKGELFKKYPANPDKPFGFDFDEGVPGGESNMQLFARAYAVYSELHTATDYQRLALVSHGGFIDAFMTTLLQERKSPITEHPLIIIATGDTGWHHLTRKKDTRWILVKSNYTDHLRE